MDVDGSNEVNLTHTPGVVEFAPGFSPDGSKIIFYDGVNQILVMDPNGANRDRIGTKAAEGVAAVKFKKKHIGSSLEDFLDEEGILESSTAKAVKGVIAWQLAEEMKAKHMTKQRLADLMRTSRAQVDRILDPEKGNVTIETLQRAALLLGRRLRLELL